MRVFVFVRVDGLPAVCLYSISVSHLLRVFIGNCSNLLNSTPPQHEEYEAISSALEKVSELASENNEAIRNRENKELIMAVMMKASSHRHTAFLL
jgi:hypothetical protein